MAKALLPVLPARRAHGRPLLNAPVPPEKREQKEGKGKEKDVRTGILCTFSSQKVERYEIGTTWYQTTTDNIALIHKKSLCVLRGQYLLVPN